MYVCWGCRRVAVCLLAHWVRRHIQVGNSKFLVYGECFRVENAHLLFGFHLTFSCFVLPMSRRLRFTCLEWFAWRYSNTHSSFLSQFVHHVSLIHNSSYLLCAVCASHTSNRSHSDIVMHLQSLSVRRASFTYLSSYLFCAVHSLPVLNHLHTEILTDF